MSRIAIDREHWKRGSTWIPIDRKAGNVLLKRYSDRVTDHRAAGTVEECISDILPMKRGRYAELIGVCLIAEGFVKIKSIAT